MRSYSHISRVTSISIVGLLSLVFGLKIGAAAHFMPPTSPIPENQTD